MHLQSQGRIAQPKAATGQLMQAIPSSSLPGLEQHPWSLALQSGSCRSRSNSQLSKLR